MSAQTSLREEAGDPPAMLASPPWLLPGDTPLALRDPLTYRKHVDVLWGIG